MAARGRCGQTLELKVPDYLNIRGKMWLTTVGLSLYAGIPIAKTNTSFGIQPILRRKSEFQGIDDHGSSATYRIV